MGGRDLQRLEKYVSAYLLHLQVKYTNKNTLFSLNLPNIHPLFMFCFCFYFFKYLLPQPNSLGFFFSNIFYNAHHQRCQRRWHLHLSFSPNQIYLTLKSFHFSHWKSSTPTYFLFFSFAHFPSARCWHVGDGRFTLISSQKAVTISIRLAKKSIFCFVLAWFDADS